MAVAEYLALVMQIDFDYLYTATKQWFVGVFALLGPASFVYDAPFGRFATPDSVLSIDGTKSWIVMELVSPLSFLLTAYLHPFSPTPLPLPSLARPALGIEPQSVFAALYLVHYFNRALVSPLRSPSRSRSHLVVVTSGIVFNAPNGFLLAAFLSSASTAAYLSDAPHSPRFWAGLALWAAGFVGNAKELEDGKRARQPHYAIPHGGLYSLVSFPNYLCEWIEWFGFALAASPLPDLALLPGMRALLAAGSGAQFAEIGHLLSPFVDSLSPPWAFFFIEILAMAPRAIRGHRWYHERFKESYPRERRAVVPWLL
ncbi:hypothetical protein BC826DRAFT_1093440 [Russula brevipes]|nr:hypothetical protein BC826DRAFT_1093440 [Russula brevipes]